MKLLPSFITTIVSHAIIINILSLVKDENANEELVQEIFLRIWQKRAELTIHSSFGVISFSLARTLCMTFFADSDGNRRSMT
jgi:DNA-directed RNA polymerase specialized sigma24 family protein